MHKLNKTQKEIEGLAGRVPKLTKKQRDWAIRKFQYDIHILGKRERECICPDCKEKIYVPESMNNEKMRCPHCGAYIEVHRHFDAYGWKWRKNGVTYGWGGTNHQEVYFQVMSVVGDWQVTRLFYMQRWCYIRKPNTAWEFYEVCQAWNSPEHGKTYFRSLPKNCMGYRYNVYSLHCWRYECTNTDTWSYDKYIECDNVLEPRLPNGANYFKVDNLAPDAKILPQYKRMGINRYTINATKWYGMTLLQYISGRNNHPMLETMLKGGDYELFEEILEKRDKDRTMTAKMDALWTAYKICKRNNYDYRASFSEWRDLVEMLRVLGMDYHSPHYVCPDNLHEMHQRILRMRIKAETNEEIRTKLEGRIDYEERVAPYLDMDIHNDNLEIVVLPNVMAFKDEADHLHHCVFRCEYYNKANSLILSARSRHGKMKRWETIEVDLVRFKILQSYGYGDNYTERHKEICDLVMENMWQIKERRLGKKARKVA